MRKPVCVVLLAASMVSLATAGPAPRPAAAAAQRQLAQTRASIQALAEQQKRLESQRSAAAAALREADGQVSGSQRTLQQTEAAIASEQREVAQLQQRKLLLESHLSRQRAELGALLRSAYALGEHEQLKLLLEQDRMSDLARVLVYHQYFQRDRQQRITRLSAQLQDLAQVGEQLRTRQQQLSTEREQQRHDVATLAAQRRQRGQLVSTLDSQYRDRGERLTALGRDEQATVLLLERLRKLMAQMPKPAVKPSSRPRGAKGPRLVQDAAIPAGPMNLPLEGTVLAGFGGAMPDGHRSQGLLIAGTAGSQVHAVSAGRVAYADWLKGYGLLVIIDHGNGWMTLYAFNDALLRNAGDTVRAGDPIATVGSSGGQGRSALYFELRRNGQPEDPRLWLRK